TTRTLLIEMTGGVLSTSKAALSSSPASAVACGFDGASDATIFTKYVPLGIVVVSQTRIDSLIVFLRVFQAGSPSRRSRTPYTRSSSLSASAFQARVCNPFWYVRRPSAFDEPGCALACAASLRSGVD